MSNESEGIDGQVTRRNIWFFINLVKNDETNQKKKNNNFFSRFSEWWICVFVIRIIDVSKFLDFQRIFSRIFDPTHFFQ